MTENNRPEWFDIAESDKESRPVSTRRSFPIAAIVAAALAVGIGAVVAQTQEESPASATETTSVANDQVVGSNNSSAQNESTAPTASQTPSQSAAPSATSTSSAIANPNITKLPTGRGEDDEDDEHEGREHHGDRQPHGDGIRPPHPEGDDD
jgi:cytoskeletal protein RodZ